MDDIIYRTKAGIKSSNTYNGLFSIDENGKYRLGRRLSDGCWNSTSVRTTISDRCLLQL